MTAGEVRGLLYQIVDHYLRQRDDPDMLFDAMIDAANETTETFRDASSEAASTRAQVLTRMLQLASRAMAALSGPVCTKIVRKGGKSGKQTFEHHPLLRGMQMEMDRRGKADKAQGARTIAHRSWWIVTLDGDTECPDARWAQLTHRGQLDEHGDGDEVIDIELLSPLELAEVTTGHTVASMIAAFAKHLRAVAGEGSQLAKMTDEDRDLIHRLEAARAAMGAS